MLEAVWRQFEPRGRRYSERLLTGGGGTIRRSEKPSNQELLHPISRTQNCPKPLTPNNWGEIHRLENSLVSYANDLWRAGCRKEAENRRTTLQGDGGGGIYLTTYAS